MPGTQREQPMTERVQQPQIDDRDERIEHDRGSGEVHLEPARERVSQTKLVTSLSSQM